MKKRILIVDDDKLLLRAVRRLFQSKGWDTMTASNRGNMRAWIEHGSPDVVLTDWDLGDWTGELSVLKAKSKGIPVVIWSGDPLSVPLSLRKEVPTYHKAHASDGEMEQLLEELANG